MTIIYSSQPIHNCTEKLIIVPTTTLGHIRGTALDDFLLHTHINELNECKTHTGTVRYIPHEQHIFALAYISDDLQAFNLEDFKRTLVLIKEYALSENLINDIAVDLSSLAAIYDDIFNISYNPIALDMFDILKKVFEEYTLTIYLGYDHIPHPSFFILKKKLHFR